MACIICMDRCEDMYNCSCEHMICIVCITHYIKSLIIDKTICNTWITYKKLLCPYNSLDNKCYIDEDMIYKFCNLELIKIYNSVIINISCKIEHDNTKTLMEKQALISSSESQLILTKRIISDIKDILTTCICCPA